MYQITLASDKRFFDWVDIIAGRIKAEIENSVVIKYKERERVYLGVALKEKGNADKVVFDVLYDFFLKDVKGQYLYSIIKRYAINEFLVQVYIKILKCFNGRFEDIVKLMQAENEKRGFEFAKITDREDIINFS